MSQEWEVIHRYTRKEALSDGLLVNLNANPLLDRLVREHFNAQVDLTEAVWCLASAAVENEEACNDLEGVIHDMLWMSRVCYTEIDSFTREFKMIISGLGKQDEFTFKLHFGGTDAGEALITIMMPNED